MKERWYEKESKSDFLFTDIFIKNISQRRTIYTHYHL